MSVNFSAAPEVQSYQPVIDIANQLYTRENLRYNTSDGCITPSYYTMTIPGENGDIVVRGSLGYDITLPIDDGRVPPFGTSYNISFYHTSGNAPGQSDPIGSYSLADFDDDGSINALRHYTSTVGTDGTTSSTVTNINCSSDFSSICCTSGYNEKVNTTYNPETNIETTTTSYDRDQDGVYEEESVKSKEKGWKGFWNGVKRFFGF